MRKKSPFVALLLAASLTLPALATEAAPPAEPTEPLTLAQTAQQAAEYAAQYGGASGLQYALWQDGKIVLTGHTGVFSRTENRAMTDSDLYGVGSVSKVYTTAAAMKLVEEGKLELDKPVTTYLPDFTMADPRYKEITVEMLLNHSSGLMGSSLSSTFLLGDSTDRTAVDDLLGVLATQRLKADPGAYSVYCNDGFTLVQLVIEAASGQSFGEYLHAAILTPAGLTDTFVPQDEFDRDRLVKTYLSAQDDRPIGPETVTAVATGGVYANASDLAAFGGIFCDGGAVLAQSSLDAMAQPEYAKGLWPDDTENQVSYGLGWDAVEYYPFQYSDIQALVKGGDTQLYHAGLVVLPEYNLSCAILSSGGVSTYSEMAAAQILIAALTEQGVTVDTAPRALPEAKPAAMSKELTAQSGLYASSTQMTQVTVTEDGTLSLVADPLFGAPAQTFTYHDDGTFRSPGGLLQFVTEENGETYLFQKAYADLPGLGQMPVAEYFLQRLPASEASQATIDAWAARTQTMYLNLTERYTSQLYAYQMLATSAPTSTLDSGYLVLGTLLTDENTALSQVQIPGLKGRDCQDTDCFTQDGHEYLAGAGALYVESAAAETIYTGDGAYCTIQPTGYNRWYQVGEAAGQTIAITLPEQGSFYVYDQNGAPVAGSHAWGDTQVTLPEGGWMVFSGAPDARFHLNPASPAK